MERPKPIRHLQSMGVEDRVIKHVEDTHKSRQLQSYDQLEEDKGFPKVRESDEKNSGEPKPKH